MTTYVNVHGKPVNVSARDAVLALEPRAIARPQSFLGVDRATREVGWMIKRTSHDAAGTIGTGASEEGAWRDAWSRILAEEVKRGG